METANAQPEADRQSSDLRVLAAMAAPIVVSTFSRTVMSFVDFAMVSQLGKEAQAAVGAASIMLFVLLGFGIGTMTCVNTYVSQCLGRRQLADCSAYAYQGLWVAGLMGVLALLTWDWVAPMFALFGHAREVLELEITYAQIGLFSVGPTIAAVAVNNFFNGIHRPVVGMISAVSANAVNILADYVLIFGNWGFPAMGVAGAAWATVLAVSLRVLWLLVAMMWPTFRRTYHCTRTWGWDTAKVRNLLAIGLPAGLQFVGDILAWGLFINWMIGGFGTEHLAASNILMQYMSVSFMPAVGVGIALTSVVGRAIGQRDYAAAIRRARLGVSLVAAYAGLMGLTFLVARGPLIRFFSSDPQVLAIARKLMVLIAVFVVFDGLSIAYNNALRGAGDTRWPAVVIVGLSWLVLIGGGTLVVRVFPHAGSAGPWVVATVFIIMLASALAWRWHSQAWRKIDLFAGSAAERGRAPSQIEPRCVGD